MKVRRIPTGCGAFDKLLGGGIESGTLTQIFGEPGSGKTNICLQLAVACAREGKKVIYIDTEGISPERFHQIVGNDAEKVASNIIIYEPDSFEKQSSMIMGLERMIRGGVGLIIVDSITFHYRHELNPENEILLRRELARQVSHLLWIARKYDIPVVITNQIYTDIDHDEIRSLGGSMIGHISKAIIQLEKLGKGRRRATIVKHRSLPEGESCEFVITSRGVEDG